MKVALGEGNFDALVAEGFEDGKVEVALEARGSLDLLNGPDAEVEIEGAVAEFSEDNFGKGIGEDVGMIASDGNEDFADALGIAVVGDADGKRDADLAVVGGPVGDALIDEFGVGDDDDDVFVGLNPSAAAAEADDVAVGVADLDAVTELDGLLEEQDEAGDKIADDSLKAQADADAEGAADDDEAAEIEAEGLEADDESERENEIGDDSGDGVLGAGVEGSVNENFFAENQHREMGEESQQDEKNRGFDEEKQRDGQAAHAEERLNEITVQLQAGVAEGGRIPTAEESDGNQHEQSKSEKRKQPEAGNFHRKNSFQSARAWIEIFSVRSTDESFSQVGGASAAGPSVRGNRWWPAARGA